MSSEKSRGSILVVDDDTVTRDLLLALLRAHRYRVEGVGSGEAALALLTRIEFDLVLLDVNLPGTSGIDVLSASQTSAPDTEFIMITAFGSIDTAVDAMKRGAYDYLRKPLQTEELLLVIDRALGTVQERREMARLRRRAAEGVRERMIGASRPMERLWDRIEQVAPTRATVLITGETGTGKELVARAIHELSPRSREPFIATNCSSLPEMLLESELFGHVRGSFTGAVATRRGLFEEANRGTLFLDEVSTMSAGIQVKLLRVVQERVIQRVGSNTPIPIDLRLLAATNVNLLEEVARGAFREDLFYRLNVFPIRVPPLRERPEDIPLLARHFMLRAAAQTGREPPELPDETLQAMEAYAWPGNVRQLENYVESAVIAHKGAGITFTPPEAARPSRSRPRSEGGGATPSAPLAEVERDRILQAMVETNGHRTRAAELLGIDRRTLYRKLKHYEAERVEAS